MLQGPFGQHLSQESLHVQSIGHRPSVHLLLRLASLIQAQKIPHLLIFWSEPRGANTVGAMITFSYSGCIS